MTAESSPQQAADELAIRRLLAAYCHRCDDGEFAELVALFAPDGALAMGDREYRGGEALLDFFVKRQGPLERRGRHLTVNAEISVVGDHGTATSDYLFLQRRDGELHPALAGRYLDEFVRTADGWRYVRREIDPWV